MDIVVLFPLLLLIGAMFMMTRSAKKKQQQAMEMRDQVQPGTGVRTIGGLYARVKEIGDDTVLLELAPGVHAHFAKNAIGAVLEDDEYNEIINPRAAELDSDGTVVPDDASSLTGTADEETSTTADEKPSLKKDAAPAEDEERSQEPESGDAKDKKDGEDGPK
ncbi:preprotein translocase subunit YajC [Streptomyces sp. P38-E01]|uniref:Preprotein translocase subunit YajC n=1 Tax=Streptomyces tardus TaxID=2780544 RepID=A0A949N9U7_9ACTN|nr:preprotein translocase subunit YajC [Streptomyces tardus]MBU7599961.1 preprotein translocase subunit YajC [Streptomyces tardus]